MEQSSASEDNSGSAVQEIHQLTWTTKFYYCVHNSPQLASILSRLNVAHILMLCFTEINFYINKYKNNAERLIREANNLYFRENNPEIQEQNIDCNLLTLTMATTFRLCHFNTLCRVSTQE
jgi:hypothetical protein